MRILGILLLQLFLLPFAGAAEFPVVNADANAHIFEEYTFSILAVDGEDFNSSNIDNLECTNNVCFRTFNYSCNGVVYGLDANQAGVTILNNIPVYITTQGAGQGSFHVQGDALEKVVTGKDLRPYFNVGFDYNLVVYCKVNSFTAQFLVLEARSPNKATYDLLIWAGQNFAYIFMAFILVVLVLLLVFSTIS